MNDRQKPSVSFIGIGVNKSATSWIFQCLREHPEVSCSAPKETHFFSRNYGRGMPWYNSCFDVCDRTKVIGEYSPDYLQDPEAPARIRAHFPQAKLILCLRNPVDRITSAFFFNKSRGKHNYQTIREKLEKEPGNDVEKSLYHEGLKRFYALFPKEQVLVLLFDEIQKNPAKFMQRVYTFLGVENDFIPPSAQKKVNKTVKNKYRFLWFNRALHSLRKKIKRSRWGELFSKIGRAIKLNVLFSFAIKLNKNPDSKISEEKKEITQKDRQFLYSLFEKDIKLTESLINRDLGAWKK